MVPERAHINLDGMQLVLRQRRKVCMYVCMVPESAHIDLDGMQLELCKLRKES